jgi:thiamine pyrophosphate-dependent acetolactate synthase large subunit-like protein
MAFRGFNEMELAERIEELPRPVRAAFAAACAERLLPAYYKFGSDVTQRNMKKPNAGDLIEIPTAKGSAQRSKICSLVLLAYLVIAMASVTTKSQIVQGQRADI